MSRYVLADRLAAKAYALAVSPAGRTSATCSPCTRPGELTTSVWGPLSHPVRTDPVTAPYPWRDKARLAFWDPVHGVYGAFSASTAPDRGGQLRLNVATPHGTGELVEQLEPGTLCGSAIGFDLDESLTVDSERFAAELCLVPRHVGADSTAGWVIPPLVPGEPLHHHQRGATVRGWVDVGGRRTTVEGLGLRDRAWGYCSESDQILEYVAVVAGLDAGTLTATRFRSARGGERTEGFLLAEGTSTAVSSMAVGREACGRFAWARLALVDGTDLVVALSRRLGGFWAPLGDHRCRPTLSAYDEFLALDTSCGESGYGVVTQGILRQLA